jgi:hypothetical protein
MPAVKPISRRRKPAADFEDVDFASFSHAIAQLLRNTPGTIVEIIEELLTANTSLKTPKGRSKKASRKQRSGEDMEAHAHLLAQALEELRYEVDRNKKDAIIQVQQLREYLLEAGQRPDIDPEGFLLVLQQFAVAKLEIGDELRDLAQHHLEVMGDGIPGDEQFSMEEFEKDFAEIAKTLKGDPFAIHGMINEFIQTMPVELRSMLVATVLVQKKIPALGEAALGWVLDDADSVRQGVAQVLEQVAGGISGATLRRMIALRNWLPETERPTLDRAIKANQKKVACASWPAAKVLEAHASFPDGAGAQSIFVIVKQGRKRAFAALLFKQGIGIRDAWVGHGLSPADAETQLQTVAAQVDLSPVPLDYVAAATRHFLGVNAQSGVMPPFNLLDVGEIAGLTDLNPENPAVDELVASLCAGIAPKRATPQAIAKALKASASWEEDQPLIGTWLENTDEAEALLRRGKLSKAKRKAALLAMPMQKHRRWWAELIAWTGYTLKHASPDSGWEEYALVARELLGKRPLDEIGIMNEVAEATLVSLSGHWL